MQDTFMPFGKHKGKPLADVPLDYLAWVLENCKLSGSLKWAIRDRVLGPQKRPPPQIITTPWMGNAKVVRSDECPFDVPGGQPETAEPESLDAEFKRIVRSF